MTQEEFKEEARRLRPKLLITAQYYLGDDDAEDTVQDVLLRLWQMVGELRCPMDALASVLVRNLCVDRIRRLGHVTLSLKEQVPVLDGSSPVEVLSADSERIDRMMGIINALPSLQQTILRLRHIEGMEMKDIAALVGTNEVALRKALSRARQAVRIQYLKQYER